MRGLVARLRLSRAVAFYRRLDGTSEQDGMPWMMTVAQEGDAAPAEERRDVVVCESAEPVEPSTMIGADPTAERSTDEPAPHEPALHEPALHEPADVPVAEAAPAIESELVPALNRVADAFERMAASIEVEHHQREVRLEAVERLLHELVTGLVQPTAVPPVVVGGSIDLEAGHDGHDQTAERADIDLADPQLELDDSDDVPLDSA